MIVHRLLHYEVAFGILFKYEIVLAEPLACLVILVITVSLGPVECCGPYKTVCKLTRVVQLKMMLRIVVSIIVIVTNIAILVIIFSGRIISAVCLILGQIYSMPCDAGVLVSEQPGQSERVTFIHPAQDRKRRLNICIGIPYVSVSQTA